MGDKPTPAPVRKSISRSLRFEILRRDSFTCRYCGESAPDVKLTVDHVVPDTLGGSGDPSNLVTACQDCNAGKGSTPPDAPLVAEVDADAERWAAAIRRATELDRQAKDELLAKVNAVYDEWCRVFGDNASLPYDWNRSIETFIARGLLLNDFYGAIMIAYTSQADWRKKFNYFCSVCWGTIDKRQRMATQLFHESKGE